MVKHDKVIAKLERSRDLYAEHLRGTDVHEIAERFDIPVGRVQWEMKKAKEAVRALRIADADLREVQALEAARLDALMAAHWNMATGQPWTEAIRNALDNGIDEETIEYLENRLPDMASDARAAAKLILDIMARRAKMYALDDEKPPANLIVMPTVIFAQQAPGERRDYEALGITIDPNPIDIK